MVTKGVFSASNLSKLFKSRSIIEQTLLSPVVVNDETISLTELNMRKNEWRKALAAKPELAKLEFLPNARREQFTRVQDSIMGKMYENLLKGSLSVAQKDKKISIINIDVASENELFSKYFCEALAMQVSDFYVTTKSKKARDNMAILQRQLDSVRGQLNGSITRVAVANDSTFNLNLALNVRRPPAARSQVDVQANTAILTELVKQSELAKVTLRKETSLIQVIDRPILPLPKERFGKGKGLIIVGIISGVLISLVLVVIRLLKKLE